MLEHCADCWTTTGASRCVKVVTPRFRAKSMIAEVQVEGMRRDSANDGQVTHDSFFLGSDRVLSPALGPTRVGITDSTWRRLGGSSMLPLPAPPPSLCAVPTFVSSTRLCTNGRVTSDTHPSSSYTITHALHHPAVSERDTNIDLEAKIAHLATLIASANELLEYWTRMRVIAEGDREELMMIVGKLTGYLQSRRASGNEAWAYGGNEPQESADVGYRTGDEHDTMKVSDHNLDENELAMIMWRCRLQDCSWKVVFSEQIVGATLSLSRSRCVSTIMFASRDVAREVVAKQILELSTHAEGKANASRLFVVSCA